MRKIIFGLALLLSSPAFAGTLIIVNPDTKVEVAMDVDPSNFSQIEAANLRYSHAAILGFLAYKRDGGSETRTPMFDPTVVTVMRTPEDGRPFVASKQWADSLGGH